MTSRGMITFWVEVAERVRIMRIDLSPRLKTNSSPILSSHSIEYDMPMKQDRSQCSMLKVNIFLIDIFWIFEWWVQWIGSWRRAQWTALSHSPQLPKLLLLVDQWTELMSSARVQRIGMLNRTLIKSSQSHGGEYFLCIVVTEKIGSSWAQFWWANQILVLFFESFIIRLGKTMSNIYSTGFSAFFWVEQ